MVFYRPGGIQVFDQPEDAVAGVGVIAEHACREKALPHSKGAATGILFKNREVKVRPATRAGKGVDLG